MDATVNAAHTSDFVVNTLELSPGETRFYNDEGYLYIPGLIKQEFIEPLQRDVLDVMAACGATPERLRQAVQAVPGKIRDKLIQSHQYLAGSALDRFVNSPQMLHIAEQLMGGPSTLYLPFTAVKSGGGGGSFHFHQDNQYTRFDGPGINLWCALTDMTPENGCLQMAPRTHLQGTLDKMENGGDPNGDMYRMLAKDPERFLPVRMRAGDCVAFSRLTIHGSGVNHTREPRIGYALQYHRDDVHRMTPDGPLLLKDFPVYTDIGPKAGLAMPVEKSRDGH
jgi:2-oxoglutarate-dependent dioxygenase